ncbi:hypothetical protein PR048_033196, partial [Dryococelus australis]
MFIIVDVYSMLMSLSPCCSIRKEALQTKKKRKRQMRGRHKKEEFKRKSKNYRRKGSSVGVG